MSPKELWIATAERYVASEEEAQKAKENNERTRILEAQSAIKEVREFLEGEDGMAAKNLLKVTQKHVWLGSSNGSDDRDIFLDADGFHLSGETIAEARERKEKRPNEGIPVISVESALTNIMTFNELKSLREVLPFIQNKLDSFAAELMKA